MKHEWNGARKCMLTYGVTLLLLWTLTGCVLPTAPAALETPLAAVTPGSIVGTPVPTVAGSMLENTSWQLVSFGAPGAELPVVADSNITLEFGATGEVTGFGGCNFYSGAYETQENRLAFGEIVSTLRACMDEGITQQELQYLEALQLADRFEMVEGSLTIWYDAESGVLNFVPASPPSAPTDTTPVVTPSATITATETVTMPTASILSVPFAHFPEEHAPATRAWLARQRETRM